MKELQTLHSIFNHRVFRIPDYQRGYAWKEKQLTDFWEDLINLDAERFHYTGVLSIKTLTPDIAKHWEDAKWLIEDRGYAPCQNDIYIHSVFDRNMQGHKPNEIG